MTIPSNSMSMQSLATIYSLGLTAGGAITMGIFWKCIYSDDETETKIPSPTIELSKDNVSVTKTESKQDKLTMPIVFGLGMLGGIKLNHNLFPGFIQGAATLGLALSTKKQEEQGTLNWKELFKSCP